MSKRTSALVQRWNLKVPNLVKQCKLHSFCFGMKIGIDVWFWLLKFRYHDTAFFFLLDHAGIQASPQWCAENWANQYTPNRPSVQSDFRGSEQWHCICWIHCSDAYWIHTHDIEWTQGDPCYSSSPWVLRILFIPCNGWLHVHMQLNAIDHCSWYSFVVLHILNTL